MTESFLENVLLFKGLYDQALDPVAQRWKLTRMELDLLLFLANNPTHNTARCEESPKTLENQWV